MVKEILLLLSVVLLVLFVSGCSSSGGEAQLPYRQVSGEEAKAMMEKESKYIILDVRTQKEYEEGHIPGAICIPNETIDKTPPALLVDKKQLIFVYCRSGRRSKQASQKLANMGYTNIVDFGGISSWRGALVK